MAPFLYRMKKSRREFTRMVSLNFYLKEQAAEYKVLSNKHMAQILGVKTSVLAYYAYYLPDNKKYNSFNIAKRGGGFRLIEAPNKRLKDLQRIIAEYLGGYYKPRACVFAYVGKRGIVEHASVHVCQRWLLRLDLKDFFHSITAPRLAGLLSAPPFLLAPGVARTISFICTKDGRLTQGAPVSPVISNIICRGLDYSLKTYAAKNKCYYTRYADDIFFSNNGAVFPSSLARKDEAGTVILGDELKDIIKASGFLINDNKTFLRSRAERQIVTGVVVNKKSNVPREYIRQIKSALHSWKKFGLESAENYWSEKIDKRNRWNGASISFKLALRGQINHVGHVKGYSDSVYLMLARKLSQLDNTFNFDERSIAESIAEEVHVFCEGESDILHLRHAFQCLKSEYPSLNLIFKLPGIGKGDGSSVLKNFCDMVKNHTQRHLTICLFDRDEPNIIREMSGSAVPYKDYGGNVFSLVMPSPDFRNENICIEFLYKDVDLLRQDTQGRRLYLGEEFDQNSRFKGQGTIFKKIPKSSLILDSDIIDYQTGNNVALSKVKFAEYISNGVAPFDSVDVSAFSVIFNQIAAIRDSYMSLGV
ncbi:reverse transcriptase domain-containing protein [Pseudomonas sp. URIL14HWK12:I6]|uniref:reverse transcriptase domain-containing protein n=1 Tax=Pseudomonas sp. URIL14HWK12:I6 TaxID=1283293 RepID=UPI002109B1A4|nr:reverse transcriptase domain-containing protein [Pseudomonas sp. URIL14HWK12:I6]